MTVPNGWIIAEMLVLVFLCGIVYYMKKHGEWAEDYTVYGMNGQRYVYRIFFPKLFFNFSAIIGMVTQAFVPKEGNDLFFFVSVVIPFLGMVSLFTYSRILEKRFKRNQKEEEEKIEKN